MSWTKRILIALLFLAIAGALIYSFRPQPVPVSVGAVNRGALEETIDEDGRTRVRERYDVQAPVSGHLARIDLETGDAVAAGDTVAVLYAAPSTPLDPRARAQARARLEQAQASVKAAEATLARAEAAATQAQKEARRLQRLYEQESVATNLRDRAAAEAEQTAAEVRAARHRLVAARQEAAVAAAAAREFDADTGDARIAVAAPVAGRVLAVHHESAGVVAAGTPLLTLGDPTDLEVVVDVLSADAVRIGEGGAVRLRRWGGEQTLAGIVRRVEPAGFTKVSALGVEEQRVWVRVDLTDPRAQWQALGDGYRVEASFVLWEGEDVLKVPASALFREGEQWAVFVAEGREARKRIVEVGHRGGLDAQVLDGLQVGEQVVLHPDDSIDDGTPIAPDARQ